MRKYLAGVVTGAIGSFGIMALVGKWYLNQTDSELWDEAGAGTATSERKATVSENSSTA